jgi:hypothetical protein
MATLTAKQINTITDARSVVALLKSATTTTKTEATIDATCAQIMVEEYTLTYRSSWSDDEEGEWSERPATRYDVQDFARRIGKDFAVCLRALVICSKVEKATRCTSPLLSEFREFVGGGR